MTVDSRGRERVRTLSLIAMVASGVALLLHASVGLLDEGRPVLTPVGHLAPFLLVSWTVSGCIALVSVALTRGRSRVAIGGTLLAVLGLYFLFQSP